MISTGRQFIREGLDCPNIYAAVLLAMIGIHNDIVRMGDMP